MTIQVICADVLDWATSYNGLPFHAILTDPPYELSFMGKHWDGSGISFQPATWAALAAHLLPGAHVLAFGGSRTHHRLMCAIEDTGLEIRDCIYWVQGAGFPKSLNVGKAIDKAAGVERAVVGKRTDGRYAYGFTEQAKRAMGDIAHAESQGFTGEMGVITAPATPAAATWEGYGSALKPAVEVIVMARKPLEGTIAANCERYGSGALNIDASRIASEPELAKNWQRNQSIATESSVAMGAGLKPIDLRGYTPAGRWPANLILDDSEAVAGLFPVSVARPVKPENIGKSGDGTKRGLFGNGSIVQSGYYDTETSAARFFFQTTWELDQAEQLDAADVLRYCAKSSRTERDAGLDSLPARDVPYTDYRENAKETKSWVTEYPDGTPRPMSKLRNAHPTVKPLTLCRYLATLLLPPAAYAPRRILVPFGGVASEAIGAMLAGWDEVVMVEREREYCDIAEARVEYWMGKMEKQIALPLEVLA